MTGEIMSSEKLREQLEHLGFSHVETDDIMKMMDPDGVGEFPCVCWVGATVGSAS